MATLGDGFPTLIEKLKRQEPDGRIADIIELLARQNDILVDATYIECNNGTKHLTTQRSGLPEPTFRKFNQGVPPSKSTTVQVEDTTGMMEDYGEVDKALADQHANAMAFRASENAAKLQGFNNKTGRYMFYGNTNTEPEAFLGLAPRFSQLTGAASSEQIVNAGGATSTCTSIWFVCWGETTVNMLYPKGSLAGFQHRDLGEDTLVMEGGKRMQIYRDHFKWDLGMSVRDWRAVSRVANIDVPTLTKNAQSGADLIENMIDAYYKLQHPMVGAGRTVIYCNRTIQSFLHKQAMFGTNVRLRNEEYDGKPTTMFLGIPIRRCDEILDTETALT